MGYVPFILNKRLFFGYIVIHIKEKKSSGNLELLLFDKCQMFKTFENNHMIKKLIKKILNSLADKFFQKNYGFEKIVSIGKSKVKFFQYI